jgi:hypothetical protein
MAARVLPASLGKPVTSRQFSWKEMVIRQWGSEYAAPDHRIYNFSNGRSFDSTDLGTTGIYERGILDIQSEKSLAGTYPPHPFTLNAESAPDATGDPFQVG